MENIATRAPWLSSLSLITAKLRPAGISPALKLHFENGGKSCGEKFRTLGIVLDQSTCQTRLAADTGRSLGFPACCVALLQHEDWFFFFKLFFHLQGCLLQPLVWFLYFKELIPKCSHDKPSDPCPPLLVCNIYRNHCTMLEDDCEQPRPLPDSLGNCVGWPTAAAFAPGLPGLPPANHPSAKHLGSTAQSLKYFDAKYLRGVLVCVHMCLVQSNSTP